MEVEKHEHAHVGHAEAHHESFWRRYVFSQDHKVIGIQYALTALVFLLTGFSLMLLMRWQMAFPGEPIPLIGKLFSDATAPGGRMLPEFFNQLGAMHGTIMVFMAIVPLVVGAFGNYVVPLQIGAPDMAFPKLNMASYWCFLPGGILMFSSFFLPGGAARSGWTSYPPLSILESGQTMWLFSMVLLITSSLLGSVNFIVTIVQLRARGLTFMRLPFFVWCQLVTSFLLLLAFPPLEAAAVLQLMDRLAGTSFFMPEGLVVSGEVLDAQRRRQPAAVAAPVLVPRPPRGLRPDPAGDGHGGRDHRQQHAQAAVGLPRAGLLGLLRRLHVVHRVGAPHVPDRHGPP